MTSWLRRLSSALACVGILGILTLTLLPLTLTTAACAPKSIQDPMAREAYTADQIVVRLNELQNLAIQLNTDGQISEDLTRKIVTFVVAADTTAAQTPMGWRAIITTGWQQLNRSVPRQSLPPALQTAFSAVDLVLGILS